MQQTEGGHSLAELQAHWNCAGSAQTSQPKCLYPCAPGVPHWLPDQAAHPHGTTHCSMQSRHSCHPGRRGRIHTQTFAQRVKIN